MGARKKISADKRKEALKTKYFAKLNNVPTSPRKMRLVADMVKLLQDWKNYCVLLLLTGNRRMNAKLKAESFTFQKSTWILLQC